MTEQAQSNQKGVIGMANCNLSIRCHGFASSSLDSISECIHSWQRMQNCPISLLNSQLRFDCAFTTLDQSIDMKIAGLPEEFIGATGQGGAQKAEIDQAVRERDKKRAEKDQKVEQINEQLRLFLSVTYQTLSEILEFLTLNEIGLRALEQAFDWVFLRRKELPNNIPLIIQEKVEAQVERLIMLQEALQVLLKEGSKLKQFVQEIRNLREGFEK
jgi:hypothetical protein